MAQRGEITLGDDAKDTITGLSGVVVAITDWLHGCQRITIQPRELKDGKPVDNCTFDVEQIEVLVPKELLKTGSKVAKATATGISTTGGPHDGPTHNKIRI